jgi:hypothetical protein
MSFIVRELPLAKRDKEAIFHWLQERSPAGAASWLRAYDFTMDRLKEDARSFGDAGDALENQDCELSVQPQTLLS